MVNKFLPKFNICSLFQIVCRKSLTNIQVENNTTRSWTMKATLFKLPVLLVAFVMMRIIKVHSTFCKDYSNQFYKDLRRYKDTCVETGIWSPCCDAERVSLVERMENVKTLCPYYGELGDLLSIKFYVVICTTS